MWTTHTLKIRHMSNAFSHCSNRNWKRTISDHVTIFKQISDEFPDLQNNFEILTIIIMWGFHIALSDK